MKLKNLIADIKLSVLNSLGRLKWFLTELRIELPKPDSADLRRFVWGFCFFVLTLIGLYSLAFLITFFYLFWLLDKNQ